MARVLIIDDDPSVCAMLAKIFRRKGHDVDSRQTLADGLQAAVSAPWDVVFLDVQMPDGSGLSILPRIRNTESAPEVIIMTGFGNADGAEIAIKNGAWDYVPKTDAASEILLPLHQVLQYRESLKKAQRPSRALKLEGIVGNSSAIRSCFDLIAQSAAGDSNVLITGETGTGKELFARAIHDNSDRADANFVVVDCAALPENIVASILFGHEKGAYTGADQPREGMIAQAHRGTLFLDEIGDLPPSIQKVFLRVLQERRYRPVGGKTERASDFRLIAATNQDLGKMSQNGDFRQDLLFRLETLCISLPPLRTRPEDIKLLANHFIIQICERRNIGIKGISPDFLDLLAGYSWPGNVRELKSTLERAISAAGSEDMLFVKHLPDPIRIQAVQASLTTRRPQEALREKELAPSLPSFKSCRKEAVLQAEREYLEKLSGLTKGDVVSACRISGLSRSRYYELLKLHGKIAAIPDPKTDP